MWGSCPERFNDVAERCRTARATERRRERTLAVSVQAASRGHSCSSRLSPARRTPEAYSSASSSALYANVAPTANIIRLGVFIKETAFVKVRGVQAMINVEQDQVWEVYSSHENRWVRAIVFKIQDDRATLRYEGILEFITVDIGDMLGKPELFRPATAAENP